MTSVLIICCEYPARLAAALTRLSVPPSGVEMIIIWLLKGASPSPSGVVAVLMDRLLIVSPILVKMRI